MEEEMSGSAVEHLSAETGAEIAERAGERDALAQSDPRMEDLERRIRELEAALADLRTVNAAGETPGRKTLGHASRLLAKGGEPVAAGSVDAALMGLSPEQRMSVKSGLLRAGLL